jgi:hypothetical protein
MSEPGILVSFSVEATSEGTGAPHLPARGYAPLNPLRCRTHSLRASAFSLFFCLSCRTRSGLLGDSPGRASSDFVQETTGFRLKAPPE